MVRNDRRSPNDRRKGFFDRRKEPYNYGSLQAHLKDELQRTIILSI